MLAPPVCAVQSGRTSAPIRPHAVLVRLSWSHVGTDAIVLTTGKSRHRREAIIPLYDALRDVLTRIPKRATTILTSSRRRPWTADGFGISFNKAKIDADMA